MASTMRKLEEPDRLEMITNIDRMVVRATISNQIGKLEEPVRLKMAVEMIIEKIIREITGGLMSKPIREIARLEESARLETSISIREIAGVSILT